MTLANTSMTVRCETCGKVCKEVYPQSDSKQDNFQTGLALIRAKGWILWVVEVEATTKIKAWCPKHKDGSK